MVIEDNITFNQEFSTKLQNLLGLDNTSPLRGILRGFKLLDFSNVGGIASFNLSHGFCVIDNVILEKQITSNYSFFIHHSQDAIQLHYRHLLL